MSDGWMDGVPQARCPQGHGTMFPVAGVVHDTIGSWPGDRDYVQANSLAHFTVGPDAGDWAQHAPITTVLYHCNGANFHAFGIEFSAELAGQELTSWQKEAWAQIRAWAVTQGVQDTYLDPDSVAPASVHVNAGGFTGWISHLSVQTDDGSAQHTDFVPFADYADEAPVPIPLPPSEDDDMIHLIKLGKQDAGTLVNDPADPTVYARGANTKSRIMSMGVLNTLKAEGQVAVVPAGRPTTPDGIELYLQDYLDSFPTV